MTPGWSVDLSTTRPPIYPKQFRVNIDRLDPTSERVNRRHLAPKRAAAAAQTRRRILEAAHDLFLSHGWNGTAIAEIARRADVSVATVYASIGRKPVLIREVIDDVLGGEHGPVPAEQRGYVVAVRAAPSAADKIAVYGAADPDCGHAWREITERRARNMLLFAADLRQSGQLRPDLSGQHVADLVWTTNSPEYFTFLRSRAWSNHDYAEHLTDLWCRLLLDRP